VLVTLHGVVFQDSKTTPPPSWETTLATHSPRIRVRGPPLAERASIDTTRPPFIYRSEERRSSNVQLKPMLRFTVGLVLATAALAPLGFAHAQQPTDDSLRIYAVDIWQNPPQSWGPGRGVYLGKGLVITAAHVVTPVARTKPTVRIAGMELPATAIGKAMSIEWI
jgi:hypothetical protein